MEIQSKSENICLKFFSGRWSAGVQQKRQNFESILQFLPDSVYAHMMRPEWHGELLQFVVKLGLRSPSEPTAQVLCILMLLGGDGEVGRLGRVHHPDIVVELQLRRAK